MAATTRREPQHSEIRAGARGSVVVLAALLCACGGELPLGSSRQAITNGQPVKAGKDQAVVAVMGREGELCAGTVVHPRFVLTAGHCLEGEGLLGVLEPGALTVFVGDSIGSAEGADVVRTHRHRNYRRVTTADGSAHVDNDIALLELAGPLAVAPVPLFLFSLDSAEGATVRIVGYGRASAEGMDEGTKRTGLSTISSADSRTFVITPQPSQTCFGDSGGPAFVTVKGQPFEQLAGVTSLGSSDCARKAIFTRVDVHMRDLILPLISTASNTYSGGSSAGAAGQMGQQIVGVCALGQHPGRSWPQLLVPLLCLLGLRRRDLTARRRRDATEPA